MERAFHSPGGLVQVGKSEVSVAGGGLQEDGGGSRHAVSNKEGFLNREVLEG